jgi:hypothetical protein
MERIGFVFIGYDQYEELKWNIHNIRHHSPFSSAPIAVVLSGDPDQEFAGYGEDVVVHVPNIVSHSVDDFRAFLKMDMVHLRPGVGASHYYSPACDWVDNCGTASILRNHSLGVKALQEKFGDDIDVVLVTESNILLLNFMSIELAAKRLILSDKVATFETVPGYKDPCIPWSGTDLFPQLFLVDWKFCIRTKFLFEYINTRPDVMEITLKDNLDWALQDDGKNFDDHVIDCGGRAQWNVHNKPQFVTFAHLDRPIGADFDPNLRWDNYFQQLRFEKQVMRHFQTCIGECHV